MKILVVFTGGTIGSLITNNAISPHENTQSELISHYQSLDNKKDINFDTISPLTILSENLQPSHWTTIIETIEAYDLTQYSGIILTHGTDTLAYTANALALCFSNIQIPLILVSAHAPLNDPTSNAHINFQAAIECIDQNLRGIYVAYKNPDEAFVSIFHAHQITQSPQLSSRFNALNPITASFKDGLLSLLNPDKKPKADIQNLKPLFSEEILLIKPYPGLNYESFNLDNHPIVLHDLYHSGTCDTNRFKPFVRQCKRQNILIFMAPIKRATHYYETTQELMDMGVHFLFDISIEHALVKIMLAQKNFPSHDELLHYLLQ